MLAVPDLLDRRAAAEPDAVALDVDGGERLAYGAWEARSRAVAHALRASGVAPGDRVALVFGAMDWVGYAVAYLGVLRAGATALHVNDALPAAEVARRFAECAVSRVVRSDRVAAPAGFAGPVAALSSLECGGSEPLDVAIDPEAAADVAYTSGTTGPAKAYLVPHGNLTFGRDAATQREFGVTGHMLVPMPLGTSTSATCVVAALTATAVSVTCRPDDVERMAELVATYAIGTLAVTPWIASRMIAARVHERHDLSSVRVVAAGSSPLPPSHARALLAMMPAARVVSACSQSEAGPALVVSAFDPAKPLAAGRPNATTELRVAGPDGEPVPDGEVGEIWLRHPAPKRLYLDAALNAGILADGWYRTKDYGRVGADGDLYFVDRGADLIRIGGGIVSSVEVEATLYEHPAVGEAAVVCASGEVVAAVALTDAGALDEVESLAAARLHPWQRPARYLVLPSLPRNQHGKVLKNELRALATLEAAALPA